VTERAATRFLQLALKRAARGTGSQTDLLYERRTSVQPIPDLAAVLGPLRWALVGGMALRAYAPERMTLDVDIIMHERDEAPAREAFLDVGYEIVGELSIGGFTARAEGAPDEMPVDVIARRDLWLDEVLADPHLDDDGHLVLPRPYLTLLKLQAGRTQDLADVQRLLAATPSAERASTRRLVGAYAPDLTEAYDALITLADLEFGPTREDQR
jgi:hypothetical protein